MSDSFNTKLRALCGSDAQRRVSTISLENLRALGKADGLSLGDVAGRALAQDIVPLPLLKCLHGFEPADQACLMHATVLLVGAGGLGGYVLELLARSGVGHIIVADGDVFEETNLNRQLLSTVDDLGRNKARVGTERAKRIAPLVDARALEIFLDQDSLGAALAGVDVVVDALGGLASRKILHDTALDRKIPVVAGGVAGWTAVVGSETPERRGISLMWDEAQRPDAEHVLGSLAPSVCLAASLMAAETSRFLTNGELLLAGRMLHADLTTFSFELYDLL